ncbi:MAG: hypothetical protein H7331_06305 [Bacteroidia bacterium]|nr:hypothetical protein [Bacteroidia bacterium]
MINIKNTLIILLCAVVACSAFTGLKHPVYVSVIDLTYSAKEKTIQITARMFANDLESALRKQTHYPVDVLNPKSQAVLDTLLFNYIKKHFVVTVNANPTTLVYVGSEEGEKGTMWVYIELQKIPEPKTIKVKSTLLYDFQSQQINIIHTNVNGNYMSKKLINPKSESVFTY